VIPNKKIVAMEITEDNSNQNTRLIAATKVPPELIEIDIFDSYNPFVHRILSI
jgi:hypothetical protein